MIKTKKKEKEYEYWLENRIENLYGKRCPDYENGCACCQAWSVYEIIIADRKGEL